MDYILLLISCIVSILLISRLWISKKNDAISKKIVWSLFLLVPIFGWLAYGALYSNSTSNGRSPGKKKSDASGWAPHWRDL
jgi:uncharacterized membrane protein